MQAQDGAVIVRETGKGPPEVDAFDAGRGVAPGVAGDLDLDLDDRAVAPAEELAGFVGRDREEPWPDPIRVTQRMELAPSDEPGGLDGVLGQLTVAAGHEGDPGHVGVVGRDEIGEGRLVARSRERDRRGDRRTTHRLAVHTL